jgi:8-oxo-dGTP diphosphatase
MSQRRVPAVGALLRDARGRVLLVLRGNEPDRGTWSLPGGRVEDGEQPAEAVVREVLEETGLHVEVRRRLAQVERPHPDGGVYVIDDFEVVQSGGTLLAGDDASAVRWFTADDVDVEPMTPGLVEHLRTWGVLRRD